MSNGDVLAISDGDSNLDKDRLLNSACVFHMCPNWNLFSTYEIVSKGIVVMENNISCCVASNDKVRLQLLDGTVRTLIRLDVLQI